MYPAPDDEYEALALFKRIVVMFGVLATTVFGVGVSVFVDWDRQIEDARVELRERERGPEGPPGDPGEPGPPPTDEEIDALIRDFCGKHGCSDY